MTGGNVSLGSSVWMGYLMDDSASKSLRLSAMLMDSSISGSFFCRDKVRRHKRGLRWVRRWLRTIRFSASSPAWLCMQPCSFLWTS